MIAVFAALAIILNTIRIPTIYWAGMFYMLCDIPVIVAFIIFGFKIDFLWEIFRIAGQEIFFPARPAASVFYPMGILTHLLIFSGIYLASKIVSFKFSSGKKIGKKHKQNILRVLPRLFKVGLCP